MEIETRPPAEDELQTVIGTHRPHRNLLTYYVFASLVLGPFFFLLLLPLYFKFRTLRYQIDEEGVSMRWGVLFRREISLNYSRLQDIHLKSNFVQRWLGLGDVKLQTASGSAQAEMTIEGFQEYELVRDFLYSRMRGSRGRSQERSRSEPRPAPADEGASSRVVEELQAARRELALLAERLESLAGPAASAPAPPAAPRGDAPEDPS